MLHKFKSGAARGLFPIIVLVILFCASSCRAENELLNNSVSTVTQQQENTDYVEEGLSDEALAILDNSVPAQPKPLSETYLNNGMSIEEVNKKYNLKPILNNSINQEN